MITCILYKKKQRENNSILRHEQEQDNLAGRKLMKKPVNFVHTKNAIIADAVQLDLVPLPERPVTIAGEIGKKNSHVVKVADLERYLDDAFQSNLLKKQHEVTYRNALIN